MFHQILRRRRGSATLHLTTTDAPRLVIDFAGTHSPSPRAVILCEAEPEQLDEIFARLAPDTAVVVSGLHILPIRADEAALLIARARRRAPRVDIFCPLDGAPARWKRRFVGNLVRFGCIEEVETISEPSSTRRCSP